MAPVASSTCAGSTSVEATTVRSPTSEPHAPTTPP